MLMDRPLKLSPIFAVSVTSSNPSAGTSGTTSKPRVMALLLKIEQMTDESCQSSESSAALVLDPDQA